MLTGQVLLKGFPAEASNNESGLTGSVALTISWSFELCAQSVFAQAVTSRL